MPDAPKALEGHCITTETGSKVCVYPNGDESVLVFHNSEGVETLAFRLSAGAVDALADLIRHRGRGAYRTVMWVAEFLPTQETTDA